MVVRSYIRSIVCNSAHHHDHRSTTSHAVCCHHINIKTPRLKQHSNPPSGPASAVTFVLLEAVVPDQLLTVAILEFHALVAASRSTLSPDARLMCCIESVTLDPGGVLIMYRQLLFGAYPLSQDPAEPAGAEYCVLCPLASRAL